MKTSSDVQVQQEKMVDPMHIMQTGMGFLVKMELFTLLASRPLSGQQIKIELGLQERGLYDFLDALVALGFLQRTGYKDSAVYSNATDSDLRVRLLRLSKEALAEISG